jgi:putative peptidoglycan lipid II flippase
VRGLVDRFFPRGALLLSVLTFGSYVMGLLRDRIFARTFGAGAELDAYNAAFILPELTLGLVVASGLAAPFIPIFARLRRIDERAAVEFGQTVLTLAVGSMIVCSVVLFLVAPATVDLVAPGFDPPQRELYTSLFRVMTVTPIIFAGSIAIGEVLVAERRFLFYGLAPLLYNVGIIGGTVALSDELGIFGPAVGAVIGALLHLTIRVAGTRWTSFRPRFRLAVRTAAVREFFMLMLPKTGSSPIEPLTFLFFTNIASTLAAGSVTAVNLARNFQSVPVSLIGVAFSLAVFPTLAATYAAGDRRAFSATLRTNVVTITALTATAAVVMYLVGGIAIELFFGGGAFDADDVALTTVVLSAFAISVPFESLGHLLSRAVYATRNTILQVGASLAGFGVTVGFTLLLAPEIGIVAIPLGFSAGSAVKVGLLAAVLVPRIRRMPAAVPTDA